MKTSIIEVGFILSPLSARGVEKQLMRLPGVHRVEINPAADSGTVVYDEAVIDLKTIKEKIRECGFHCHGEMLPKHICAPEDPVVEAAIPAPMETHREHAAHPSAEKAAPAAAS
ncbi:MAG: heavy metal-associated domain-containing protein, partial [Candidatus Manganitrophaceae bacterium]